MSVKPMPILRCLIIDDEPHAHEILEENISQISWLQLVGNAYSGEDALVMIADLRPDLIFLDINLKGISGLQMLELLPVSNLQVIMTTAYHHYAVDGYDFDVTYFLLKPAVPHKFVRAVSKALEIYQRQNGLPVHYDDNLDKQFKTQNDFENPEGSELKYPLFGQERLTIKVEKKLYRIPYIDILFLEGSNNYVKVHAQDKTLKSRGSLTDFELGLAQDRFLRVQKSYIINRDYAGEIDGNVIIMLGGHRINMSQTTREQILESLSR